MMDGAMECRIGCAACCIAISISAPVPGFPGGKPAGVPCGALSDDGRCRIWGTAAYPETCRRFRATPEYCGQSAAEALMRLERLEEATRPSGS